ncbi:MAG: DUF2666 family protein [Candidatus Micrarchaeota archaeon]|nr:DUF2666 family protein [Candidatus Micrarchaeota archaeon]
MDQVAFAARFKDWMVVKKLLVDATTKPEEVSLTLASIDKTIARKSYEFTGINADVIDAYVATVAKKGHTFANLADVFKSLQPGAVKAALLPACPTPEHYPIAESYFVKRILEEAGYAPVLEPETLAKVFPHLKITKPRGNYGGKKKK